MLASCLNHRVRKQAVKVPGWSGLRPGRGDDGSVRGDLELRGRVNCVTKVPRRIYGGGRRWTLMTGAARGATEILEWGLDGRYSVGRALSGAAAIPSEGSCFAQQFASGASGYRAWSVPWVSKTHACENQTLRTSLVGVLQIRRYYFGGRGFRNPRN
jgi:hypothetical protein